MCTLCANFRPFDKTCAFDTQADNAPITAQATIHEGGDAAASTATTYRMTVEDSFRGRIGDVGDSDWIRIQLQEGQTYRFDLIGNSLADPMLALHDRNGILLAANDDMGPSLDSRITFTASESGTYFLDASAYGSHTGSYVLTVAGVPKPAVSAMADLADYLVQGYWGDVGQQARAFDTSDDNIITVNLTGLDATGRSLARDAMAAWSSVADLRFRETTGRADIRFDDGDDGAYAWSSTMGRRIMSSEINIDTDWLRREGGQIGTYGFQTYLHEIGHALGLGHQGNYNGWANFGTDAVFLNDSWQASVMSYFSQSENPNVDATMGFVTTPMPADIIAIQALYGVAGQGSLTAGNTVFGVGHTLGDSWLGRLFSAQDGNGDPTVRAARSAVMTIHDVGGIDTLNLGNDAQAQRVDLRIGASSDVYGMRGNLQIAPGTVIEVYVAGSGGDLVRGNIADNILGGRAGDDTLHGASGDDVLNGGDGADRLLGGLGHDRLFGNRGDDVLTDLNGNNLLSGGFGNDDLRSGAGRDSLHGGQGDDLLRAGGGRDILTGGAGNDRMAGNQGEDRLSGGTGADRLEGGTGNDVLRGQAGYDRLFGFHGNDTLVGGQGADRMAGGPGEDVFRFFTASDSRPDAPDLIVDFQTEADVVDMRALGLAYDGWDSGTEPALRWNHANGLTSIEVDLDGDRQADMVIRLAGLIDLQEDHFLL
ncbi:M10 family metallopeptidase C-terminal domain-containing protein [Paracoccus indicus]|uniref:M10 family metallopeptidase C-terminal domain-containing protein n=1 Tax=Paracoccus indicus TaxID=2079229 RepID=UPI000D3DC381|nr:M10 family metallopeptidase C-terminal domain-containing protein [Paracoccus indicus]